ncbi:hypothetical protein SAMN03159343_2679 [Klenkia marina]|uniref:Uncharacterized protein n=1 Tax=Klenkia marina TaxID=1960309 RepID=A0A1G4YEQ5_9ACTN|nr:hypothetical protein [Klenkia marina]SCX52017.1 hypothetical protein SAMN03159343_2679 [Klenkia marina]
MNVKKLLGFVVVAFVLFYVISQPERSADIVRTTGTALADAAGQLSTFVGSLF